MATCEPERLGKHMAGCAWGGRPGACQRRHGSTDAHGHMCYPTRAKGVKRVWELGQEWDAHKWHLCAGDSSVGTRTCG